MKKSAYLAIGLSIGLILGFGHDIYAATVSLIGQKIQGEFIVTLNGKKLNDKAIVTDGRAFLPVRTTANEMGLNVNVDGNTIILTLPDADADDVQDNDINATAIPDLSHQEAINFQYNSVEKYETEIIRCRNEIENNKNEIVDYQGQIKYWQKNDPSQTKVIETFENNIDRANQLINQFNQRITDLEAEKQQLVDYQAQYSQQPAQ